MRNWLLLSCCLTIFLFSGGFSVIKPLRAVMGKSHLSAGFLFQRTVSIRQKACSCPTTSSCSCCQSVTLLLRAIARNLCVNFTYAQTGLSMTIMLGSNTIRYVSIIDYRAFKVCTSIPDCFHSFICVDVMEVSQFPRSVTICMQLDIMSKTENWLINYNCISLSTLNSTATTTAMPGGTMPPGQMPGGTMQPGQMPAGQMPGGTMQPGQMPGGTMQPGQMPGGAMQPGQMPGGTMPPGQMPGGTMQPGQMPAGQIPGGTMQPGQMPAGQMPGGTMQPGQMPGGAMQPGQMPAGQMPGGAMQPGQMPGGTTQPGQMPAGQMPGGAMQPGQMPGGTMQPGQMPAGQMPGGAMQPGQMPAGQMPGGAMQPGQMPGGTTQPGQMPAGQMPGGAMQPGQMPGGTMQPGQMPAGQMPGGAMQPGQMPGGTMQPGQMPAGQMPGGAMQPGQMPGGTMQPGQMPGGQMPAGQMPAGQFPGGQMPTGQFPGGQMPTGQFPGGQMPTGQFPGGQMPTGQFPGGQMPTGQFPGGQTPQGPLPMGQFAAGQQPSGQLVSRRGRTSVLRSTRRFPGFFNWVSSKKLREIRPAAVRMVKNRLNVRKSKPVRNSLTVNILPIKEVSKVILREEVPEVLDDRTLQIIPVSSANKYQIWDDFDRRVASKNDLSDSLNHRARRNINKQNNSAMKMQVILRSRKTRLPKITDDSNKSFKPSINYPSSIRNPKIVNQDTISIPMSELGLRNVITLNFTSSNNAFTPIRNGSQTESVTPRPISTLTPYGFTVTPPVLVLEDSPLINIPIIPEFSTHYDNRTSSFPDRMPPSFGIASRIGPIESNKWLQSFDRSVEELETVVPKIELQPNSKISEMTTTEFSDGTIIFPE